VSEIGLRHCTGKFPWEQPQQCNDVGLLHHLRALSALSANHHVNWHRDGRVSGQVKRFERVETSELS
jgi:hypothetical protein